MGGSIPAMAMLPPWLPGAPGAIAPVGIELNPGGARDSPPAAPPAGVAGCAGSTGMGIGRWWAWVRRNPAFVFVDIGQGLGDLRRHRGPWLPLSALVGELRVPVARPRPICRARAPVSEAGRRCVLGLSSRQVRSE